MPRFAFPVQDTDAVEDGEGQSGQQCEKDRMETPVDESRDDHSDSHQDEKSEGDCLLLVVRAKHGINCSTSLPATQARDFEARSWPKARTHQRE